MNCPRCGAQMITDSSFLRCLRQFGIEAAADRVARTWVSASTSMKIRVARVRGYSYEVLHQPAFSLAVVQLQAEQSIQAEAGAMVSMSAHNRNCNPR